MPFLEGPLAITLRAQAVPLRVAIKSAPVAALQILLLDAGRFDGEYLFHLIHRAIFPVVLWMLGVYVYN